MRWCCIVLGMLVALSAASQDAVPKKKKPSRQTEMKAHQKPSKDQIRRFNELQKKQRP